MRQLAIIGSERSSAGIVAGTEGTFELEGIPVRFGIVETPDLSFDANTEANADLVFIRVRAFSCNYRDRVLMLRMPETITTYADLTVRADELGCGRALRVFIDGLERCFHDEGHRTAATMIE